MRGLKSASDRRHRLGANFVRASDIAFRWRGAEYHLDFVRSIIEGRILDSQPTPRTMEQLHWHLSGFYWELAATFDCLLQVCSAHYQLGISRGDIKWEKFKRRLKDKDIDNPLVDKINETYNSEWYQNALDRRHYITHWGPPFITFLRASGKIRALKFGGHINIYDPCANYLSEMRELVVIARAHLPEGNIPLSLVEDRKQQARK